MTYWNVLCSWFVMIHVLIRIKRMCYLVLVAWMLGVSNVILEETRMVHETRNVIEQKEIIPDTDFDEDNIYVA